MLFPIKRKGLEEQGFINLQNSNEQKLEQFIEFFEYACYKFSWILNYNKNTVGGNNHTHGGVIELLNRIRIPRDACEKWILESEHGFLHGFCTLYLAYCLHPKKQLLWDDLHRYERHIDRGLPRFTFADNMIVSYLFHDMMQFIYPDHPEDHDKKLSELSNLFLPEVYTHSNPTSDSFLTNADRLELMRFKDYADWLDFSKIEKPTNEYGGTSLINHFYDHIRPVIEKMFVSRNDIWFSHALEVPEHPIRKNAIWKTTGVSDVKNNLGVSFYPKFHWMPIDEGYKAHMQPEYEKYFSVHSGRLPFNNCIAFTKGYYRSQAIISLADVKKHNCEITCAPPSTAGRDHLFVIQNQKIPTKEWCFLYDFGTNKENQFQQIELNDLITMKASLFNHIYRATETFLINLICLCLN